MNPASPFDDALADLRVSGNVLLHETYVAPWAITIPAQDVLRAMLGVEASTRVMPFHLVLDGEFELTQGPMHPFAVTAGEVAICAGGTAHVMSSGRARRPIPFAEIIAGTRPGAIAAATTKPRTTLLCGVFLLANAPLNPLLGALPAVLKVRTSGNPDSPVLAHAADMLALEVARGGRGSFTASRLLEVFCAEAIAGYRRGAGGEQPGWFMGLADVKIGRALEQLHGDPGRQWSVEALAGTVSMSPSRFAARFRETTGESVMSYVARWRMNTACRQLQQTEDGLAEISQRVGYTDVASFSRAFKSLVGCSPSAWRARTTKR